MISFLRGVLATKNAQSPRGAYFLIDVNGVGYEVASSVRSVESAPQPGELTTLHTSLIVREDAMSLVGFNSREERDLFNILHSAQGVGPKVALAILSALSVPEIAQAVMSGNFKVLTAAKGVGPKLAEKLTVDLKEKMAKWRQMEASGLPQWEKSTGPGNLKYSQAEQEARHEAENVLLSLGYASDEIARCFAQLEQDAQPDTPSQNDAEHWLRAALRWFAVASA
ncbi:MAG: Holliday junction branch migration protein RuvA [Vampirovibrionales bacterium]|nr:Holliday junction branch migration protein RuvA [Vampirovibrionales bacterium]